MFNFLRRKQQAPQPISPTEAREIVEEKLRDPNLTSLERGVLMQIATHCEPQITPSVLSQRQADRVKPRP